ncbi:molybdate ABC transporter substrate-binding protein [Paenisporosarcina antarctica]|uniref:Molybdate ABC transporter substrate-binding protein n=1 Tax=Paenisporosarcina antarctica TaxID=417367 RepID=A0A4P6ZYE3_9BACL|nr:molybdate ABC transporter substrate-binding protein [Paenisporosarcina antarctica]QBP41089.1 molybdate ABC transporter substrate-binding protein [Paenisporosarcina antarctica]
MKNMILLLMLVVLVACGKPSTDSDSELVISTASSLKEAMLAIEIEFGKVQPNTKLMFNFASSGKLRSQIHQGAPADVFLSASLKDMDILADEGLIIKETVMPFAENRLVLASLNHAESNDFSQLLMSTHETIAIGEPKSVPLGEYTKQALDSLELWGALKGKMIYAKDARQVLTYIESGNAGLGVIYFSDTKVSQNIKIISELPEAQHPIIYPAGIAEESQNREVAEAFLTFLTGKEGQKILEQYGFTKVKGG